MIEELIGAVAGGLVTGLAVLPYAIRLDRRCIDLAVDNEQQAHALANASARARDADHRLVEAATRRSEDAAVIARLDRLIEANQAEIASLVEQVRIHSEQVKAAAKANPLRSAT